jgi:hypothetical protein
MSSSCQYSVDNVHLIMAQLLEHAILQAQRSSSSMRTRHQLLKATRWLLQAQCSAATAAAAKRQQQL